MVRTLLRPIYRNISNSIRFFIRKDIIIGNNVATNESRFEGKNCINCNTVFVGSSLGYGTYIGTDCNFSNTEIGRYCSIGAHVRIVTATHPSRNFVSTHPAFFSLSKQAGFTYTKVQRFEEYKYLDEEKKLAASIGNDVWICDDVKIMGGVKIHDGAILATGALITKDVPPYTIVAGIPAKIIGKRFTDAEIKILQDIKWWEKSSEWLSVNIELFSNIQQFIKVEGVEKH